MDILDIILSGPILFGIVVAVSFGLVAKAITGALGQIPGLKVQLDATERSLDEAIDGIPEAKDRIGALQEETKPLKQLAQHLQDYSAALIDVERRAMEKEKNKERAGEIPVHRPGPSGQGNI